MLIVYLKLNEEWPSRHEQKLENLQGSDGTSTYQVPPRCYITIWTLSLYQATDVGQIQQFIGGLFTKFHNRNEHRLSI